MALIPAGAGALAAGGLFNLNNLAPPVFGGAMLSVYDFLKRQYREDPERFVSNLIPRLEPAHPRIQYNGTSSAGFVYSGGPRTIRPYYAYFRRRFRARRRYSRRYRRYRSRYYRW